MFQQHKAPHRHLAANLGEPAAASASASSLPSELLLPLMLSYRPRWPGNDDDLETFSRIYLTFSKAQRSLGLSALPCPTCIVRLQTL
ncbi:hypothetical protein U9M48_008303 [Paspalum notatum var. saurae]|uniref:Uncharacterized protein n=1 Tax=Paspalum notatum var. saurae TaxID=547442 RepID=A0AAQ3WD83_PASNO